MDPAAHQAAAMTITLPVADLGPGTHHVCVIVHDGVQTIYIDGVRQ